MCSLQEQGPHLQVSSGMSHVGVATTEHSHRYIVAAEVKDYGARYDVLPQFSC